MAKQSVKFAVGGPVQAKSGTYLSRPADEHLFNGCKASEFSYVLACRQIGKSSLMFETAKRLRQIGIRTAMVDLNEIGRTQDADSWYFSLIDILADELNLTIDVQSWWDERVRLTIIRRFLEFLYEVVLKEISEPVIIFVDEIDMTFELNFTDDFFAAIRTIYNDRAQRPAYHRLTFVLLGVATPDDLIQDSTRTPFNIGQAIALRDFTKEECAPFRFEIEARYPDLGTGYFDQIYDWTNGHPYLTQKLCDAMLEAAQENEPHLVKTLAEKHFLAPTGRDDINLQTVQKSVIGTPYALEMLEIYKRIIEDGETVYDDEQSPAINRLKLYGLVVAQNGKLCVRNRIYAQVFDMAWVEEMLKSSRAKLLISLPSKYKVLQQIGQGGFATVYLAQVQNADQIQSVALKVLRSDSTNDGTQVKRFKQEARAVARLNHPNIIHIFETGGDEDTLFIVMEYISGGSLRERLKKAPLSRDEAIHILRQVGDALTYAHHRGIIHRDVNPNNILLDTGQDSFRPRPVLTDFGLIKVVAEDNSYTQTQIRSVNIQGTLDYMAPEQWKQKPPSPATDLYALAITFFEMLAGETPFDSDSFYDLMDKHTSHPLPLLSQIAPEVGSYFDQVLCKAAAKDPADRFQSTAEFIEAIEAANEQAEQAEQSERQHRAAAVVEAAQGYIQKGRYDPEKALSMVEAALEIYPRYLDALRLKGKIRFQQDQIEKALEDYELAYELSREPSSEIGQEYLEILRLAAESFWQRRMQEEAAARYGTILKILADKAEQDEATQKIWQEARARLIEYHYQVGKAVYALGDPDSITEAIAALEQKIHLLEALEADSEHIELQEMLKLLQIKKYKDMINDIRSKISSINAAESHVRFSSEDVFQHYLALDEAYQALIELEPENTQWSKAQHKALKDQAVSRHMFGLRALGKLTPDYEAGLRHYKAIFELEQTKYPGISQELKLDLDETINELQSKVDHDGKYNEIIELIDSKKYQIALERLDQEFIQTGNYEHREVAKWLWGLVYAKHHDGNLPPEWEGLSGFESLSKHLVRVERRRIRQLKDQLEAWSQAKILKTINHENRRLQEYEEQVTDIEASLNESMVTEVTDPTAIERCRSELADARQKIRQQRQMLFQDMNETVQQVEVWLQKIEDIEALLKTGNPVQDIPQFLHKIDAEQQAIENDPTFKSLQALVANNADIEQIIDQIKLQVQESIIRVLVEDVGRRDEQLAVKYKELVAAREASAELQRKEVALHQRVKNLRQLYHVFSVSLIPALIMGGFIGVLLVRATPAVQNLPWLMVIAGVTLIFWIGGLIYIQMRQ